MLELHGEIPEDFLERAAVKANACVRFACHVGPSEAATMLARARCQVIADELVLSCLSEQDLPGDNAIAGSMMAKLYACVQRLDSERRLAEQHDVPLDYQELPALLALIGLCGVSPQEQYDMVDRLHRVIMYPPVFDHWQVLVGMVGEHALNAGIIPRGYRPAEDLAICC